MTRLSSRRKESSTAFLSHWCVIHSPPVFSATRSTPASSAAITAFTASLSGLAGFKLARFSQASSMIFFCLSIFRELHQALGGFDALRDRCDERNADVIAAGIGAAGIPCEEASRQHEHIVLVVQAAREVGIVPGRFDPQIEAAVGHLCF